jgi:hypothetical protein
MQAFRNFGQLTLLALIGVLLFSPLPVSAHHGWGGYSDAEFEITGTVETPVSLAGPHAALKIRDAQGKIWNVVLAPSPRTAQAGLKEGIIPPGATVTAHGHRHQNAATLEVKTERLTWGDRVFNVYPDRD